MVVLSTYDGSFKYLRFFVVIDDQKKGASLIFTDKRLAPFNYLLR